MNAKSAPSFQIKSKFDLGDNLLCPSLASVSKLFNGVYSSNLPFRDIFTMHVAFQGLTKFTIASTALGNG